MLITAYHLQKSESELEYAFANAKLMPRECLVISYEVFKKRLARKERIKQYDQTNAKGNEI